MLAMGMRVLIEVGWVVNGRKMSAALKVKEQWDAKAV